MWNLTWVVKIKEVIFAYCLLEIIWMGEVDKICIEIEKQASYALWSHNTQKLGLIKSATQPNQTWEIGMDEW